MKALDKVLFVTWVATLICLFSCGTFRSAGKVTDGAASAGADAVAEVKHEIKEEVKASNGVKTMFYIFGALCIFGAIGVAVVFKDVRSTILCIGGGFVFMTAPFFLDLLYQILGPLKWAIYILIFCALGGLLTYGFFRAKIAIEDLLDDENDDRIPASDKIRQAFKLKSGGNANGD